MYVRFEGDEHRRQVFYDGSTVALYDMIGKRYAVTPVPDAIDGALDPNLVERHAEEVINVNERH